MMKYPVLIHKDSDSDYGVTIPDIHGCFTAGKTLEEAIKNIQEAVELFYEGEVTTIPPWPSDIEALMSDNTLNSAEGFWFLADIDFSFLSAKTVRVNITLPEYKLAIIDRKAKEKGLSRSAFLIESAEKAI